MTEEVAFSPISAKNPRLVSKKAKLKLVESADTLVTPKFNDIQTVCWCIADKVLRVR